MNSEHPFAQYIRILGKGKSGARGLSLEEMQTAFGLIMSNDVEPEQLGAFLMLLRYKEETAEEVAGAVLAIRKTLTLPENAPKIDLDWSSYAGKRRHLPWLILTNLLLAQNGVRIFMHGASGHTAGRVYTKNVLGEIGMTPCSSLEEAAEKITKNNFAYLDLEHLSPVLHKIIELRPILGLRSPVHTIARMVNPFDAPYAMQSVFHPGYQKIHLKAGKILQQKHLAVFKGEGGEVERNPDAECLVDTLHNNVTEIEEWPALFTKRHVKDAEMNSKKIKQLWAGEIEDEYALAAVTGTAAIAIKLLGKAGTMTAAQEMAELWWKNRTI